MLIKSVSKAGYFTLELYVAWSKSAELQEYKLIMPHAVDVLRAPVLQAKGVCQCQSLLCAQLNLEPASSATSAPRLVGARPPGHGSGSSGELAFCRNAPHPEGTSFLAVPTWASWKLWAVRIRVAVTQIICTLYYIKNEITSNLTQNSEILPSSSWKLRHTAV